MRTDNASAKRRGKCGWNILAVLWQAVLLLVILLFMLAGDPGATSPLVVSRVGLCITLLCAAQLAAGGVLKPPFLLFATFALFSFGIPLLVAVDPSYTDGYLLQVNQGTYAYFSWYTVLCIQAYSLGLTLAGARGMGSESKALEEKAGTFARLTDFFDRNRDSVSAVCLVLFVVLGVVCFYYSIRFTTVSVSSGIGVARSSVQNSALDNLCRGLFVPTGFMLLIYSDNRARKRNVLGFMFLYAALTCLSGDRTEGLTLLVAVFVYWFWRTGRNGGASLFKGAAALLGCLAIVALIPAIASFRIGGSFDVGSLGTAVADVFSELGFNFYTVCFQSYLNLPIYHGETYLVSLTSLVPSSLDFLGIREAAHPLYGEVLYNQAMGAYFPWATFGLGYSLVAESYLNFRLLGFIVIFLFGYVAGRLCGRENEGTFDCYLSYSFLWAFLTLARRGFDFPVNSVEYILVFLPLIVFALAHVKLHLNSKAVGRSIRVRSFYGKQ